ncbi:hypothetical protein [Edwardsiella tarda]|uniref:hypothetical protein n=1 Tax=Edwardsiella tarda TaxID=636 RepID=UPI00196860E0|nr:hypothetical protein [Edwardsiella tarda]
MNKKIITSLIVATLAMQGMAYASTQDDTAALQKQLDQLEQQTRVLEKRAARAVTESQESSELKQNLVSKAVQKLHPKVLTRNQFTHALDDNNQSILQYKKHNAAPLLMIGGIADLTLTSGWIADRYQVNSSKYLPFMQSQGHYSTQTEVPQIKAKIVINPVQWATMSVLYDFRSSEMKSAVITLGDYNTLPVYLSAGLEYLDFGGRGHQTVIAKSAESYMDLQGYAVTLGYHGDNLSASASAVEQKIFGKATNIGSYLFDTHYDWCLGPVGGRLGGSYITDIKGIGSTDSDDIGMPDNNMFEAVTQPNGRLPAYALYGRLDIADQYHIYSNYMKLDGDLAQGWKGSERVRPSLLTVNGSYDFDLLGVQNQIIAGYDRSSDAFGLRNDLKYMSKYNKYSPLTSDLYAHQYSLELSSRLSSNLYLTEGVYLQHDYDSNDHTGFGVNLSGVF